MMQEREDKLKVELEQRKAERLRLRKTVDDIKSNEGKDFVDYEIPEDMLPGTLAQNFTVMVEDMMVDRRT